MYAGQGPGAAGDGAGGPAAPLEELGHTRHLHLAHDRRIRAHHLRRTTRTHAYHLPGPSQGTVLYTPFVNFSEYTVISWLKSYEFSFTGTRTVSVI